MKKIILSSILLLISVLANAEIKFKSIDNYGETHLCLVDNDAPKEVNVSDAMLYSNGKKYIARKIRCDVRNGVAIYKLTFKKLTLFKNCKVSVKVNGENKTIDIQKSLVHRKVTKRSR